MQYRRELEALDEMADSLIQNGVGLIRACLCVSSLALRCKGACAGTLYVSVLDTTLSVPRATFHVNSVGCNTFCQHERGLISGNLLAVRCGPWGHANRAHEKWT